MRFSDISAASPEALLFQFVGLGDFLTDKLCEPNIGKTACFMKILHKV